MVRIAIDINDVLRDNVSQFKKYYNKMINPDFEINTAEITSFDLYDDFPFDDRIAYNKFKYEDCPFELFGRAEPVDKMLPYRFNNWTQNTLRDFEEDKMPEVFLFSPFEIGITIQSTCSFLSKIGCRIREIRFPIDSFSTWDNCDIMVTANPNLIDAKPEGKTVIKIEMPYNKDIECEYSYTDMMSLIQDENDTIIDLINKYNEQ